MRCSISVHEKTNTGSIFWILSPEPLIFKPSIFAFTAFICCWSGTKLFFLIGHYISTSWNIHTSTNTLISVLVFPTTAIFFHSHFLHFVHSFRPILSNFPSLRVYYFLDREKSTKVSVLYSLCNQKTSQQFFSHTTTSARTTAPRGNPPSQLNTNNPTDLIS